MCPPAGAAAVRESRPRCPPARIFPCPLSPSLQRWKRAHLPDTASEVGAAGIGRFRLSSSQPSWPAGDGQRARSRGRTGTPTSRSIRLAHRGIRDGLRGASPMATECP